MKINALTPESETLNELGRRLARIRKQKGYSQATLSEKAGIGIATLKRIELGNDSQIETWLKILKALDMIYAIDAILPENFKSPMADALKESRGRRKKVGDSANIIWGDEQQ